MHLIMSSDLPAAQRLIDEGDELLEPLPAHALEDAGQLTRSQRGDLVDRHLR